MSSLLSTKPSHRLFRGIVLVFAFVLGCQSIWILAAEFYRPFLLDFPASARAATAADRNAAALAASYGFIRGDLWAEYTLTYFDLFQRDERYSANAQASASEKIEQVREIADRALAFAPHNARIWLVLADIDSRFDWLNHNAAAALRMSYYTGPNENELIPLRLPIAVSSSALADKNFQQLVRDDIHIIVTRKPALKPVILTVYQNVLPIGQRFIEETLEEIDPTLLAELRSTR